MSFCGLLSLWSFYCSYLTPIATKCARIDKTTLSKVVFFGFTATFPPGIDRSLFFHYSGKQCNDEKGKGRNEALDILDLPDDDCDHAGSLCF